MFNKLDQLEKAVIKAEEQRKLFVMANGQNSATESKAVQTERRKVYMAVEKARKALSDYKLKNGIR